MVDIAQKKISYHDSIWSEKRGEHVMGKVKHYLQSQVPKLGVSSQWKSVIAPRTQTPQQKGNVDCGVFMCQSAKCIVEGRKADFGQRDVKYLRRRMALELMNKYVL